MIDFKDIYIGASWSQVFLWHSLLLISWKLALNFRNHQVCYTDITNFLLVLIFTTGQMLVSPMNACVGFKRSFKLFFFFHCMDFGGQKSSIHLYYLETLTLPKYGSRKDCFLEIFYDLSVMYWWKFVCYRWIMECFLSKQYLIDEFN